MAIVITASQIYEIIDNHKIIDNPSNGIEFDEDELKKVYGTISNTIDINMYEWTNDESHSTDFRDFLTWSGNPTNEELYNVQRHLEEDPSSQPTRFIEETISADLEFNINEKVNSNKIYLMADLNTQYFNKGENADDVVTKSNFDTQTVQIAEINYNGEFTINYTLSGDSNYLRSLYYVIISQTGTGQNPRIQYGYFRNRISLYLASDYYTIETNSSNLGTNPKYSVESNELLQTTTTIDNKKLSQYIYEQITGEWGGGKETATLKCSIGEYYDENNNLVISTKNNDLQMTFNIRDLVIPYIPTARGGTEPMSIKLDGTPKVFQVTQVRPYFDGACWQEIMLQEANETQSESLPFIVNRAPVLTGFPFPYYVESITVTSVSSANGGVTVSDVEVTISSDHKDISVDVGGSSSSEVTINLFIKYSLYK